MILAWFILVLSMAMFFFCFQFNCQEILSRPFDREYFQSSAAKVCKLYCTHSFATAMKLLSPCDLPTTKALNLTKQVPQSFPPIQVLSSGEPLFQARRLYP